MLPKHHIIAQYRNQVWHCLDNNLIPSALFVAERLCAYDQKNPDSAHLFALCYFRDGQIKSAETLAKKWLGHLGCAYIYAQCCLVLGGGKQKDGIAALEMVGSQWEGTSSWNKHTDTERRALPDAASINCLLGKLYHSHGQSEKSVNAFAQSVKLNPLLWESFEGLLDSSVKIRIFNVFKQTPEMVSAVSQPPPGSTSNPVTEISSFSSLNPPSKIAGNAQNDPFMTNASTFGARMEAGLYKRPNGSESNVGMAGVCGGIEIDTPTALRDQGNLPPLERQIKPPGAALRKTRATTVDMTSRRPTGRNSKDTIPEGIKRPTSQMSVDSVSTAIRRSTRVIQTRSTSKSAAGTIAERSGVNAKERETKKPKIHGSRSRTLGLSAAAEKALLKSRITETDVGSNEIAMTDARPLPPPSKAIDEKQQEAQFHMIETFKMLGVGYHALSRYSCQEALQIFNSLPPAQRDTPWVLSKIGRTYYEMANYQEAEKAFIRLRQLDPMRTRDMEVYSTVLWHLRKEVEMSALAHELVEIDRLSPQAWCAIGNSFSLQRDHEQALKCFKRATQLDPKLAYAFTLQGHEYVSSEEYEKALVAYRSAIAADNRHYNAWYGLGKVFDKTGKYDQSEKHFNVAAQINPTNAVLVCCVGMVLEKNHNLEGALAQYELACQLSPRSALSRFKKARVLIALGNYHSALAELLILKDIAPDEANVHYTLGKLYKALKDRRKAVNHFTTALHLDPKANHLIKEAMENLEDAEVDDDSSQFISLLEHS